MATLRLHHGPGQDHPALRALSGIFWSLVGGVILLVVFFAAMGAFDPRDAVGVTIAFAALGVLWLVHAWPRLRGR